MATTRLIPTVTAWRSLAPFGALFVLLLIFALGGMVVIAHEADRSDAARAREAVLRTFTAALLHLDAAAEMNAATPPVAGTLSGPRAKPASAYEYFNFTNRDAFGYYGTLVLNADGSPFAGTHFGVPWTGDSLAAAARLVAPVAARLRPGVGTLHALIRDRNTVVAVAVADIVDGSATGGAAGRRRLAMIAPVAAQLVPRILPSLGVEAFRMTASGAPDALRVPVDGGPPIVFTWRPRNPGRAAIERWAPAIGGLLVLALAMLGLAVRTNLRTTRALEHLALHDSLTGLPNRAALLAELERRLGRRGDVVLGLIDLNGFKRINDEFGHAFGDEVLQAVAGELARSAADGDFVGRLGGDEFAWISASWPAAERFRREFASRSADAQQTGRLHPTIGAGFGIAAAEPGVSVGSLMALADARLYDDKSAPMTPRRTAPQPAASTG